MGNNNNKTHFDYEELRPHITNKICDCGWIYIVIVVIVVVGLICLTKCLVHHEIKQRQCTHCHSSLNTPSKGPVNSNKEQCKKAKDHKKHKVTGSTYADNLCHVSSDFQHIQKGLDHTLKFSFKGDSTSDAYLWLIAFLITIIVFLILSIPMFRGSEQKRLITLYLDDKELEHKLITDILKEVTEKDTNQTTKTDILKEVTEKDTNQTTKIDISKEVTKKDTNQTTKIDLLKLITDIIKTLKNIKEEEEEKEKEKEKEEDKKND